MLRKKLLFKKILTSMVIFALVSSNVLPVFASESSRAAKIVDLSGTVNVIKAGGEKKFNAFKGMSLSQGDSIVTGSKSWVELEIDEDKLVKIAENTRLGMSELTGSVKAGDDKTGLKLWFGKVWTNIKKKLNVRSKYEIRTPKTVMGVRGTQFFVGEEGGKTVVAVLEGRVYAVSYTSEQRPDGSVLEQAVEAYIEQNQQTVIDNTAPVGTGITVQPVQLNTLPSTVLEEIRNNPAGIDPSLIQNIDTVIEERRTQEAAQQQQEQQEQEQQNNELTPQIISDPNAGGTTTPQPSGSTNPGPVSSTPVISFSLSNSMNFNVGTEYINFTTSPADASVTAASNNSSVVSVTCSTSGSGSSALHSLNITANNPGTAVITVTANKSGYQTTTKNIDITVIDCSQSGNITVINNGGANDYLVINDIPLEADCKIYYSNQNLSGLEYTISSQSVSNGTAYTGLLELNKAGGTLEVCFVESGIEGPTTQIAYPAESDEISLAPDDGEITVINNFWHKDYVEMEVAAGDIVKVYDARLSGRTRLGYGILPINIPTGHERVIIDDFESDYVYVSLVRKGKKESYPTKVYSGSASEYINVNSIYGAGCELSVSNRLAGDYLKVYTSKTGGELIAGDPEFALSESYCFPATVQLSNENAWANPKVYVSVANTISGIEGIRREVKIPTPAIPSYTNNLGDDPGFGSTKIASTLNLGTRFVVRVSKEFPSTPIIGSSVPTGPGVIDPYTPNTNITGVDSSLKKFIEFYEVDSNNKIVAFSVVELSNATVNGMTSTSPIPYTILPGSDVGSSIITYNWGSEELHVKVNGNSPAPTPITGTSAASVSGAVYNPTGTQINGLIVGDYLGLYKVSAGNVIQFNSYNISANKIKNDAPSIVSVVAYEDGPLESGLGPGDKLTIIFDKWTNKGNTVVGKAGVDAIINWGLKSFGTDYSGVWDYYGNTFTITCLSSDGTTDYVPGDMISIKSSADLKDYYNTSDASVSDSSGTYVVGSFLHPDLFFASDISVQPGGQINLLMPLPAGIRIQIAPPGLENELDFNEVTYLDEYTEAVEGQSTINAPNSTGQYSLYLRFGQDYMEFREGTKIITVNPTSAP